jgi:peroxiredoxin
MRSEAHYADVVLTVAALLLLVLSPGASLAAGVPKEGDVLPSFELPAPSIEADVSYLGLKSPVFKLKDIDCQVLLVEVIGVYCPFCYKQAPLFNKLFTRLNKKDMGSKVKMFAIAAGGTVNEVEHLRKNGSYEFPVVMDESYSVHKLLGEPRTPFTMLVSGDGKVLHTHLGPVEDMDALYQKIQGLVK